MTDVELLSTKEVLERLKISKATLWRWIRDGRLSIVKFSPRKIYVEKSELQRFIEESRKEREAH